MAPSSRDVGGSLGGSGDLPQVGAAKKTTSSSKTDAKMVRRTSGIPLKKYLESEKVASLRELATVWIDDPKPPTTKKELVKLLFAQMSQEGIVYRRVRQLTRRALDVLLLFLRRNEYTSDLPGLFQRLPGEKKAKIEFREAEAGVKALVRRGFLSERMERQGPSSGRVLFSVPMELGASLLSLFREETRTVASLMSLGEHLASLPLVERTKLRTEFPDLAPTASDDDAATVLAKGGASARIEALPTDMRSVVSYVLTRHRGMVRRGQWSRRHKLKEIRWDRHTWARALEAQGVGTVARTSLKDYGLACDDEVMVIFREVLEALMADDATATPPTDQVLSLRGDFIADLCTYLEAARRTPLKLSREGEVYKTSQKKVTAAFVTKSSALIDVDSMWHEVHGAAERLGLVHSEGEEFLELLPAADAFLAQPLEEKLRAVYTMAIEQGGSKGQRSLHQHEMRKILADVLREQPERWWPGRSLAAVTRHRYLESMDALGIPARYKDRFFSAYFSKRETPADLLDELDQHWLRRMHALGLLDAACDGERVISWRLSVVGARVFGAEVSEVETGLKPLIVNPDFEILVLPEGDVIDVIHTLDQYARREKTGDVVHFRLTKEAVEAAVGAGRSVEDLLTFLGARSRAGIPQNVEYSLKSWAGSVTFATYERGVVLRASDEAAMDRILAFPEMTRIVIRRLLPNEVLLRELPDDRKLLAKMREQGIELREKI